MFKDIDVVLKKNIITEYGFILGALLLYVLVIVISVLLVDRIKGWEGLGAAVILLYGRMALFGVIGILVCVVNPIRILVKFRPEMMALTPMGLKILMLFIVAIPIPLFIAFGFFGNMIGNKLYDTKYNSGKDVYKVNESEYKTPSDFRDDLASRGLFFDEKDEDLMSKLNGRFTGDTSGKWAKYYYSEASMMPLTKEDFADNVDYNVILPTNGTDKYPAYIYNSILVLPEEGGTMQYAPLARYEAHTSVSQPVQNYPYFADCYVECKILYVDGKMYAIIGVDESYRLGKAFDTFDRPFYVILSETEDITTYYEGKFYPSGAIRNAGGGDFEFRPNTIEMEYGKDMVPNNYPVRVVEHLDRETIDAVARELQQGMLKDAIGE